VAVKHARLEKAFQLIRHRFGDEAIGPAVLLPPPRPVPIDVRVNARGEPAWLIYGGLARAVQGIENTWRVVDRWWSDAVQREYFQVLLPDESFRIVFQDVFSGFWHLERSDVC
jgi:hypothetical protein